MMSGPWRLNGSSESGAPWIMSALSRTRMTIDHWSSAGTTPQQPREVQATLFAEPFDLFIMLPAQERK